VVTPGQGSAFQRREEPGGSTIHIGGPAVTAPYWLRLRWNGGEVTATVSTDGKQWKEIARTVLPFEGLVMPGLILSGHNANSEADAAFDSVKVEAL
jgi:hypothetical protein